MATKAAAKAAPATPAEARVTLYDLAQEWAGVRDLLHAPEMEERLAAAEGEMPAELVEAFDRVELPLNAKAERLALFILEQERTAQVAKAEAARFTARARVAENLVTGLKLYALRALQAIGWTEAGGDRAGLRVVRNGGQLPGSYTADPSADAELERARAWPAFYTIPAPVQPAPVLNGAAVREAFQAELDRLRRTETLARAADGTEETVEEFDRRTWEMAHAILPPGVRLAPRGHHVRVR